MVSFAQPENKTPTEAHNDALLIFKEEIRPAIGRDALPAGVEDLLQQYAGFIDDSKGLKGRDVVDARINTQVSIKDKIVGLFEGYASKTAVTMACNAYFSSVNEAILGTGRGV